MPKNATDKNQFEMSIPLIALIFLVIFRLFQPLPGGRRRRKGWRETAIG
jgi:hypothetical protein